MTDNVIPIEAGMPHEVREVICIACHHRYICCAPEGLKLKKITCAGCGAKGKIIATGEYMD